MKSVFKRDSNVCNAYQKMELKNIKELLLRNLLQSDEISNYSKTRHKFRAFSFRVLEDADKCVDVYCKFK